MPNSLRNLFGLQPGTRDNKDSPEPAGADQSIADICNDIELPDASSKLNQRSIRFAAREKVLDCRCYLRLQGMQTCGARRRLPVFIRTFRSRGLVIVARHAHSLGAIVGQRARSVAAILVGADLRRSVSPSSHRRCCLPRWPRRRSERPARGLGHSASGEATTRKGTVEAHTPPTEAPRPRRRCPER
jgi:hypothetical protein